MYVDQEKTKLPSYDVGRVFLYVVEGMGWLLGIISLLFGLLSLYNILNALNLSRGLSAIQLETFLYQLIAVFTGFAIVAFSQVGRAILEIAINTRFQGKTDGPYSKPL